MQLTNTTGETQESAQGEQVAIAEGLTGAFKGWGEAIALLLRIEFLSGSHFLVTWGSQRAVGPCTLEYMQFSGLVASE